MNPRFDVLDALVVLARSVLGAAVTGGVMTGLALVLR